MSTHASIWTPRHTHKLWPKPKAKFQIKATPYVAPPPPPPLKKPPPPDEVHASAEFLETVADKLLSEANSLEGQKPQPGVRIQLGLYLLEKDDAIKGVLKAWDTKNKGEFLKGEFRLNLRTTGIAASSAEADDLFDSWDDDKGGSLDLKELRRALLGVQEAARVFSSTPDPNALKAQTLRKRAHVASEAARATAHAEKLEDELAALKREQASRADVQLGNILNRRRIKPGAVVTSWAKSRGEHSGELSKAEFRREVWALGLSSTGCTQEDIDKVFDTFDEDGGGYMDAEEAAAMIKGLQATADEADHVFRRLERAARGMRARAVKKAAQAQQPVPDVEEEHTPQPPAPSPSAMNGASTTPAKKRKKKKSGEPLDEGGSPALNGVASAGLNGDANEGGGAPAPSPSAMRKLELGASSVAGALGSLLRDSERKRTDARRAKEQERMQAQALHRLQKALLWKGWHTWVDNHEEAAAQRAFCTRALLRMKQGLGVGRAFETWREAGEARGIARAIGQAALRHWVGSAAAYALRGWEEGCHACRRKAENARRASRFARRLQQPKLAAGISAWKLLLSEPPPPTTTLNPCVALARCIKLQNRRCLWFFKECTDTGELEDYPTR